VNENERTVDYSLPLELQKQVDEICNGFERAWKSGEPPAIEDHLPDDQRLRFAVLEELVHVDLERRLRAGEAVRVETYLQRFPELSEQPQLAIGLIRAEYELRHADSEVTIREYEQRFPQYAEALDAAFGLLQRSESPRPAMDETESLLSRNAPETSEGGDQAQAAGEETSLPERLGRFVIQRRLGQGAFGSVYLARDPELDRLVALKVPVAERFTCREDVDRFVQEARTAAQLNHPGIVTVHDVVRQDETVFIVQEYIQGRDLGKHLKSHPLTVAQAAEIMVAISEAVAFAHQKGFVHRDLKPGNILLDESGKPRVADFGLAVHESIQRRRRGERSGTPAYMSPEQVRGETHRLDGRSDIWSLGVIFYQMLTGRVPFAGETREELFDEIKFRDPRPPRQIKPKLPAELERICLKCLSKRVMDRYSNVADLTDDLRHWHAADSQGTAQAAPRAKAKIVPKGLRSFDENDADFFLDLLPGPRDRNGLPESVRFWKNRIEETDASRTFAVGLIYGPSGCGKSSLVRAGLLPRLASHVSAIYVEATPADTELRLLKGIRRWVPDIPPEVSLAEALEGLREGLWTTAGQKIVLVLDQLEQWLNAHRGEDDTQLLQSLRHCDGGRLQCVVLIRDDFWLANHRFMQGLDVELIEGHNSALVDLFDPLHARKVLAEFGRALGRLPDNLRELTKDQQAFLDRAVEGLAEEGKVICVRVALFADMVKGKPWSSATLKHVGGIEGLGMTFLIERFSAGTAPAAYRHHQIAAQAVLKGLLPTAGTNIRGGMRSYEELLAVSGYDRRPKDFDDLIRVLDNELRLITPTDPEGFVEGVSFQPTADQRQKCYQLTHDYLVPSLREWLTRKQKETCRGRAELRLGERAAQWNDKPENRHLPAWWEYLNIRCLTHKRNWLEPQRNMMERAGRYHALRAVSLATLLCLVLLGMMESYSMVRSFGLVRSLVTAETSDVPGILEELGSFRRWANPRLRAMLRGADENSKEKLHASLALLPTDTSQVAYLKGRLLSATPEQVPVLIVALRPHHDQLKAELWDELAKSPDQESTPVLQAAAALADYDTRNTAWGGVVDRVAEAMVSVNPVFLCQWMQALKPVKEHLLGPLSSICLNRDGTHSESQQDLATKILADYAADNPVFLATVLLDAEPSQFNTLFTLFERHRADAIELLEFEVAGKLVAFKEGQPQDTTGETPSAAPVEHIEDARGLVGEQLIRRQANAAAALLRLGRCELVWPLFQHSPDPRLRSWLIHRVSPLGVEPATIADRLRQETDVSARRGLILSLGGFNNLSPSVRARLTKYVGELLRNDPDAGVHGACEWLLRRWGETNKIEEVEDEFATGEIEGERHWYVNGEGQTMVLVEGPVEFVMGSPGAEQDRANDEVLHRRRISRSFAIGSKEVTVGQFQTFSRERGGIGFSPQPSNFPQGDDCPVMGVTWLQAAAYCRWLSEQENVPEDQICYPPIAEIKEGMTLPPDYLSRTGYRLPTEAEWEYTCRAGAVTSRCYGQSEELLSSYAWYLANGQDRTWPVASLKPNEFGLFDMYGNVEEWCHDSYGSYGVDGKGESSENQEDTSMVSPERYRILRGGSCISPSRSVRSARRSWHPPMLRLDYCGFRPARTYR
jgi:serine/threonine protein kinase/formylglycine-generating enzyme required for sulfatase activity